MKSKNIILSLIGFIFGLFIFLLPIFAEAACGMSCTFVIPGDPQTPQQCSWMKGGACACERLGLIGSVGEIDTDYCTTNYTFCCGTECDYNSRKCACDEFPSIGSSGQNCTAMDRRLSGLTCYDCFKSGKWDPNNGQCVECSGKIGGNVWGDTTQIADTCNNNPLSYDSKCESACGAASVCDEKSPGDSCGTGKECDSNCQCITVCTLYDPTVTLSPSSQIGDPGEQLTYTASIKNNNSGSECGSSVFNLTKACPSASGWTCTLNKSSVTVSPGSTDYSTRLYVTSPSTEDPGDYLVYVSAANNNDPSYYDTDDAIYTVAEILPDLIILEIENEDGYFFSDRTVHYRVQNQGESSTGIGFYCSLYVDGYFEAYQYFSNPLSGNGATRDGEFDGDDWLCTPGETYYIEVCADDRNGVDAIDESDESNNCETETLTCPTECTGTLDVSISGSGSCTVTAEMTAANCDGKAWEIDKNGSTRWAGTVSGNDYYTTETETVGIGTYDYDLYIDDIWKDSDSATCLETPAFDFSISVIPNSGSVVQGNSTPVSTVTATLISGTSETVSFYIGSGLPSGASASFVPSSCNPTCSSSMTISTSATTLVGTYQLTVCGTSGTITRCYSYYELTVTPAGAGISPPSVTTNQATNITLTSATLNGYLNDLGGAPSCLVWFEWGTSGTAGVSGSYGNSTIPTSLTSPGPFLAVIPDLSSDSTYFFEAFAKNGGSW